MNLFEIKDFTLVINPAVYTLRPFKKLWDRDKSPTKKKALEELGYIYYFCDFKSDFSNIVNQEEKHNKIVKDLGITRKFTVDQSIQDAMQLYEERQNTILMEMYKAALTGLDKIRQYITDIDLTERDDKNKPIHNAKQINDLIKELVNTADSVDKLEKRVKADLQHRDSNARGSKEKSAFEDGV